MMRVSLNHIFLPSLHVAVLLAGVLGFVTTVRAADFVLEAATGSVWLDKVSLGEGRRSSGEWRLDGSFSDISGPFSPFGAGNDDGLFSGKAPLNLAGRFYLTVDVERFYYRTPEGPWAMRSSTSFAPPGTSCKHQMKDGSNGCLVGGGERDARGLRFFNVFGDTTLNFSMPIFYETKDGLRPSQGAEVFIKSDVDTDRLVWLEDGQTALILDRGDNSRRSYTVVTAAGRRTQAFALPGAAASSMGDPAIFQAAGQIYLMQSEVDQVLGLPQTVIYRIDGPTSSQPKPVAVATLPNVTLSNDTDSFRTSGSLLYWYRRIDQVGGKGSIQSIDLSGHQGPQEITSCATDPYGRGRFITDDLPPPRPSLWVSCGATMIELQAGQVRQRLEAAGKIDAGQVLSRTGDQSELIVTLSGSLFQRFFAGGGSQLLDLSEPSSPSGLWPAWEEHGRICGVKDGVKPQARRQVLCQQGSGWSERKGSGPTPYDLLQAGGKTWVLEQAGTEIIASSLDDLPGAQWQELQRWPAASGEPTYFPRPLLLRHGIDRVAVDFGTPGVWVVADHGFQLAYPHQRLNLALRSAIGSDGLLYDLCREDGSRTGVETAQMCTFTATGQRQTVAMPGVDATTLRSLHPLSHGMLVGGGYESPGFVAPLYVLRGAKAIAADHLYGEFSEANGKTVRLRYGGDGSVLVRTTSNPYLGSPLPLDSSLNNKYYRFDGSALSPIDGSAEHHGRSSSYDSFDAYGMARSGQTANLTEQEDPVAGDTWQARDGIWRRAGAKRAFGYAKTALDAAFGDYTPSRNEVTAAVQLDGQTWIGSREGLFSCPSAAATILGDATYELAKTKGCQLRQALPMVRGLRAMDGGLVVWQAARLLFLRLGSQSDGSDDRFEVLEDQRPVTHFAGDDRSGLSWIELDRNSGPQTMQVLQLPSRHRETVPLPPDLGPVKGASPHWLCTGGGLYWRGKDQPWQHLHDLPSCKAMASQGTTVLATDGQIAVVCSDGHCAAPLELPESYLDDTVLGTLKTEPGAAPVFGWVSGKRLYRLDNDAFTLATPTFNQRTALVTKATSCHDGIIALLGGGVVGEGGAASVPWWHIRMD